MKVRMLQAIDLCAAVAIERATFPGEWTLEHHAEFLATPRHYAQVVGPWGAVHGFVWYFYRRGYIEIELIGVSPRKRGKGIGRALIKSLKRQRKPLRAWVGTDNPRALEFYAREGFEVVRVDAKRQESDGAGVRVMWTP